MATGATAQRIVGLSDLHLDFGDEARVRLLCRAVRAARPTHVLVGGDTGVARTFVWYLRTLAGAVDCPVSFVLGNHDYYGSGVDALRAALPGRIADIPSLRWLGDPAGAEPIALGPDTGLVGHGGWGDAREGAYDTTAVVVNDFVHIEELTGPSQPSRIRLLRALGDEAAAHLAPRLSAALERFARVLVTTHVPPFREACWHEGRLSGADWLPWFVCRAVGEVLLAAARRHPERELLVLCGHTHSGGRARPLPNLEVRTAPATYGAPAIAEIIETPA